MKTWLKWTLILLGVIFLIFIGLILISIFGVPKPYANYIISNSEECGYSAGATVGGVYQNCSCSGKLIEAHRLLSVSKMQAGGKEQYYCFKGTCSNCKCYSSVTHKEISCYFNNFEDIFGTKLLDTAYKQDKRIAVFPDNKLIEVQAGKEEIFTFAVQNTKENSTKTLFSYNLSVENINNPLGEICGKDSNYLLSLINLQTNDLFELSQGEEKVFEIKISSEENTPKCIVRYIITVNEEENKEPYARESIDVLFE